MAGRAVMLALIVAAAIGGGVAIALSAGHSLAPATHHATISDRSAAARQPQHRRHPAAPQRSADRDQAKPTPSLAKMLGQMIVARFAGEQPTGTFLARIRRGEIGGVILFSDNTAGGVAATKALTDLLQRTAKKGRNPPLLIMTDQEGGQVKRLPGPPTLAPSQMTTRTAAFSQGKAAGQLLRSAGINLDLAPVADVEHVQGSFLGTRTFGTNSASAALLACAFAHGLRSQGVAYTLKHFPGLGRATANTDTSAVTINASAQTLRSDYPPYKRCGADPLGLVMISSARYPALSGPLPAVMSHATYAHEVPMATGGMPAATISDDLEASPIAAHQHPARTSVNAGLDLLLYAQTERGSAVAYRTLLADARAGTLNVARIRSAAQLIASLKRTLGP